MSGCKKEIKRRIDIQLEDKNGSQSELSSERDDMREGKGLLTNASRCRRFLFERNTQDNGFLPEGK